MSLKRKWDMAAEIAPMKKLCSDSKQVAWFQDTIQRLEEAAHAASVDFFQVTQLLSRSAGRIGVKAAVLIFNHAVDGWKHMQVSLAYRFWSARIRFALCDRSAGQVPFLMGIEPLVLAHAICTGQDDMAHWLGNRGVRSYQVNDQKTIKRYQHFCSPVNRLVLQLFGLWTKQEVALPPDPASNDGFEGLIRHWGDKNYVNIIAEACDHYISESNEDSNELGAMPYHVFPVPLLALLRIRKEMEFPGLTSEHPLLNSGFTEIPNEVSCPCDPLLSTIERCAREAFLSIGQPY